MVFFNFLNYFALFFYASGRNETKQNDNFYFPYFSSFSDLFWFEMDRNRISFIFWIFTIFMEFSITLRVGTKRNDNFYFLYFPTFSNLFWLIKPHWYFLIFWIFLPFFWNFLSRLGKEWNGMIIFIFSLSQPFPAYFRLKWSHNGIF